MARSRVLRTVAGAVLVVVHLVVFAGPAGALAGPDDTTTPPTGPEPVPPTTPGDDPPAPAPPDPVVDPCAGPDGTVDPACAGDPPAPPPSAPPPVDPVPVSPTPAPPRPADDPALPPADAVLPAAEVGPDLRLDVDPEFESSRTGVWSALTAFVEDPVGDGVDGVWVDFEVVAGPGDDDVGTAGDTPESPDLTCLSEGGGPGVAATCSVSYTEGGNVGGADAVRAWIDGDGDDATVEADSGEGRKTGLRGAPGGAPGCAPDTSGEGNQAEPDATDCVAHHWSQRLATYLEVFPEERSRATGEFHSLVGVVLDQDGKLLSGAGTDTPVLFYFRSGSPHDTPPFGDLTSPDLACSTDVDGYCFVSYVGKTPGTDRICGAVPAEGVVCDESVGAADFDDLVDSVKVTWLPFLIALDVVPEAGLSRTGAEHVLTARVADSAENGVNGVAVDFEVVSGPGDDDAGTPGDTPESPDLSCVADGGGPGVPAECNVSYTEAGNVGGHDAVRAWVDKDGDDATVEADLGEGRGAGAVGSPGCAPDTNGQGHRSEPDDTDCVTHGWVQRRPTYLEVVPEEQTLLTGDSSSLIAIVLDQYGNLLAGAGTDTPVSFYFQPGSPHDPPPNGDLITPDLACSTGVDGYCFVSYVGKTPGTDRICSTVPKQAVVCDEPVNAHDGDLVDTVTVRWEPLRATFLDVSPEAGTGTIGDVHKLVAVVLDQRGALFAGPGTDTEVRFAFLADSAPEASPSELPTLTCHTGDTGVCAVAYVGVEPGTDIVCGLIAGRDLACDEAVDAPEHDNAADVVTMTWTDDAVDPPDPPDPPTPPGDPGPSASAGGVPAAGTTEPETSPFLPRPLDDVSLTGQDASRAGPGESVARALRNAAEAIGKVTAFPIALLVVLLIFLSLQNRIDRKDRKLALTRSDTEVEVEFE